MNHTIILNDQQLEILKTIFIQIESKVLIVPTSPVKTKKLTKTEKIIQDRREYRAAKNAKKRK